MDENNNEVNRLDTVLGVKEDKSAGSEIKSFIKKVRKIPEKQEVEIKTRADFSKTNKEFNKQLKTWDKINKRRTKPTLFRNLFGDKHKLTATKKLFADMEKTARKSVQKYNAELDALLGKDRLLAEKTGKPYGGEIGDTDLAIKNNLESVAHLQDKINTLTEEYNTLLAKQEHLGLKASETSVMEAMEDARTKLSELEKDRNTEQDIAFDSIQPIKTIDTYYADIKEKNKELAKLAAGLYSRTGDEKLFASLEKQLQASIDSDDKAISKIITRLRSANGKKGALIKQLNTLKKQPKSEERDKAIAELQRQITKAETTIKRLNRNKQIAEHYLKVDKDQMSQYKDYYANKDKPQAFGENKDYRTDEYDPKFDAMMRKKTSSTKAMVKDINKLGSTKAVQDLDKQINATYDKLGKLQIKLQDITSKKVELNVSVDETDTEETITKQIEEKKKAIKDSKKALDDEKKAGEKLVRTFEKLKLQIEHAKQELKLLKRDMQIDPIEINLESSDLKKYNDTAEDIKYNVAAIGRNWRKSNVFTRLASRILLNIRSQIADMINPLTLFRRGWEQWINRFDNLPWKNTFDVIAYNLVTAFAPVFEWMAKALIKVAQIANVFIKRWTGVDLFDKSAWQLEQIKKGLGQLTAGFDELHSSNENPNQFNTIFDTDPMAVTPLSEELTKKLEEWADRIAKAFGWIADNWLTLVGLWAGFKLGSGLLHLLDWVGKVKSGFEGWNLIKFGDLTFGLLGIVGTIELIKAAWDSIDWSKNWGGMLPQERLDQGDKNIDKAEKGGGLLGTAAGWFTGKSGNMIGSVTGLTGGISGAIIGYMFGDGLAQAIYGAFHTAVSGWKGVTEETEHFAAEMGEGIGKVAGTYVGGKIGIWATAKLGATIGSAFGPIGTAVGTVIGAAVGFVLGGKAGEIIGKGFGKLINGIQDITRGKGDFQKLKVSLNDVEKAMEMVANKTSIYNNELSILQQLEQQTGENGEKLFEAVQSGSVAYENLSTAQQLVYNQYVKTANAEGELLKAQQQSLEYSAKYQEQLGKNSGSFTEYINTLQKGMDNGIISQEKMIDYFAQTYGKLDADSKKVFLEQLPAHLRESVVLQGAEYETLGNKIATAWENIKTSISGKIEEIKTNIANGWENIKLAASTSWENIKTTIGNIWEGMKTLSGNIWNSIKIEAGEAWESMKTTASTVWENIKTTAGTAWENIKNSVIGQKIQETVENAKNGWEDLKTKTGEVWENLKTKAGETWSNIKDKASETWENIKESAIGEKVQEIWKNTTDKFEEIKTKVSDGWNTLKTNAKEKWNSIKTSIVDAAKSAWNNAKGFFDKIAAGVKKAWESIKSLASKTGEKVGNFFEGKGFKTDEEYAAYAKKNNIPQYAVGTNYVPNDQLAMVHKGEAIIPAKYNKPYQPPTNSDLENTISAMTQEIANLRSLIQSGIPVKGEFKQRGSDLVAVVEKGRTRNGNAMLSNPAYAR